MRLNAAVFTTDYDELQLTYRSGVAPYLANAGKASIDGAELEMTWLPSDNWTIDGGIGYSTVLDNGWMITPRVDYSYRDDVFWDANNTQEIAVNSSNSLVNVGLALGPNGGPWLLRAAITNATDELYSTGGNSSLTTGAGYGEIAYARPREYYLTFSYDF